MQSLRTGENPVLWLIAGPNGSGKSTLYNRTDIEGWGGSVWIVNPDLLTSRLQLVERLSLQQANKAALDRIEDWLRASISVHQTIGVETVLSTSKYRPLIEEARARGFEIRMCTFFWKRLSFNWSAFRSGFPRVDMMSSPKKSPRGASGLLINLRSSVSTSTGS